MPADITGSHWGAQDRGADRVQGATSDPEAARPACPQNTGSSGRQNNASKSQDEEHQQPVEPERGDNEASPATHPL